STCPNGIGSVVKVVEIRHVGADAGCPRSDRRDGVVESLLISPGDEDVCAFGGQPLRGGEADSGVAAGDQCRLAGKLTHSDLLCSRSAGSPWPPSPVQHVIYHVIPVT